MIAFLRVLKTNRIKKTTNKPVFKIGFKHCVNIPKTFL
jgi:hypothetical protein